MKKYLILGFVIGVAILTVSAGEDAFYKALQTCSKYSSSGQVKTEGMVVKSIKKIEGWQDNKCLYKEAISYSGMNTTVTCRFSHNQVNELANVIKAYNTVQQYSSADVDTSSLNAVKDNPVINVWNKYLQDSSICETNMGD